MALYIKLKDGETKQFHIPFDARATIFANADIKFIQADGDELETITTLFCNRHLVEQNYIVIPSIPLPKARFAIWYGDIAKTILANL